MIMLYNKFLSTVGVAYHFSGRTKQEGTGKWTIHLLLNSNPNTDYLLLGSSPKYCFQQTCLNVSNEIITQPHLEPLRGPGGQVLDISVCLHEASVGGGSQLIKCPVSCLRG